MKKILFIATFLIAASAHAENPRLDYAAICNGLKAQTLEKVREIIGAVETERTAASIQNGLRKLNDRNVLLTEFCGADMEKERSLISDTQKALETSLNAMLASTPSADLLPKVSK